MTLAKRPASLLFVATIVTIYSVIWWLSRTSQGLSHAALVSAASAFDLTVTASSVFYFLMARNGHSSWLAVIAVALAGLGASWFVLPNVDHQYLSSLKWISVPLELALIAVIVVQLRRIQPDADVLTRIRRAASKIIPYDRLVNLLTAEIAVFYFTLFSWRSKPEIVPDSQTFSCTEASGYGHFATLIIFLILCESIPLHFVLLHYSACVAWIFTGIDAYGLLWALAIIRAIRLRTIVMDERCLKIRVGMVWEAEIPMQDIVSCRRTTPTMAPSKAPGYLKAVVLNEPQFVIELSRPAVALGLYGQHRKFTQIGISVDQKEAFASALNIRLLRQERG